jgi:hemin uptake protein HemP
MLNEKPMRDRMTKSGQAANATTAAGRGPGPGEQFPQRVSSQALLSEGRELIIEHRGREYRLRVTSKGKLILTA